MIKKNKRYIIVSVLFLIVFFLAIFCFPLTISKNIKDSSWDGVVADSFSGGNGSSENPFIISSAGELAYLKELLESNDNDYYLDKHYMLTTSFNYGGYDLTINTSDAFKGTIDGVGNTISNFTINGSIFNELNTASIKNLAFKKINYTNDTNGAIIAKESNNSLFENIIVEANISNNAVYGGLIYKDNKSDYKNIIINSNIANETENLAIFIYEANDSHINNILIKEDIYDTVKIKNTNDFNVDYFKIVGSKIELNNADTLKNYITDSYEISTNVETFVIKIRNNRKMAKLRSGSASIVFEEHNTEITNDVIYINDLIADYNYYMGLNYVTSSNGSLPTTENKNIYNDSNLVKVMISYSSVEENANNTYTGYIGYDNNEHQTKIVYYKYYPVVNNKVTIKLIDNPFTNRPNNKGFNNWISDTTGVKLSLDRVLYERYATVDAVSNGEGGYNDIALSFHASYVDAKVSNVTSNDWSSVFSNFDSAGLVSLETTYEECEPFDMTGYYYRRSVSRGNYYTGYSSNGTYYSNRYCSSSTCTYYTEINGEYYNPDNTYYRRNNNSFSVVNPSSLNLVCQTQLLHEDMNMAGYYVAVEFSRGASYTGYYDINGNVLSGTCNSSTCTYYEFLQSFDESGNEYIVDIDKEYYYLATRDTNIAYLAGNISGTWSSSYTKPFTFTGLFNGTRSEYTWNVNNTNVYAYNDTTIENMIIYSQKDYTNDDPSLSSVSSGGWFGTTTYYANVIANYNNLKIGRGLRRRNNNTNFDSFVGGNASTGSSGSDRKYKFVIESGFYSSASVTEAPARQTSDTLYIQTDVIYGNDIDRAAANNNNLVVYFCASSSWAGKIYSSRESFVEITVKSGSFGLGKSDMYSGIYVGGRSYGTHNAARSIKVEGGYIYNLIGGPLTASNRANKNDTYIYQTGGSIDMIVAGAGRSATYGNRIISLTGGKVNYSVFGGSNGSGTDSSNGDGTLNGTSYIYVGGNSVVGDEALVNSSSTLFGAEAGSIFGIGNGKSGYSNIGSNDNSNIIVDGNSHILKNIYGGGNFGATGLSGSVTSTYTNIKVLSGTIDHNIYGGGNQNGAGDSSTNATINIDILGGHILGSVYGGSNLSGTIYGNTTVSVLDGIINYNVYGGGEGSNTFVSKNVNITIGDNNKSPRVSGAVYGGSAFGTTNATSTNGTSLGNTTITMKNGVVQNMFGGGEGNSSNTPYVNGNITINVNGGSITNLYGGHDQAGSFTKTNTINLNNGIIENVYGGGNKSGITSTNIYLNGSEANNIYGGSNLTGTVNTTNIHLQNGKVNNVYGGNNLGGSTSTTNITIDGNAQILTAVFGGGNETGTTTSNITAIRSNNQIPNIYGGGNKASVTTVNINESGANINNLYGGSNQYGAVNTSTINHNSGTTNNIYGGNNQGGTTVTSTINFNGGNSTNIFGGGNVAPHTTSNILIKNGSITNIYGGGNKEGLTTSNLSIGDSTTTNLSINNIYGGSNESGAVNNAFITINKGTINNVYGGNNQGGTTSTPTIIMNGGIVTENMFGGGNVAETTGNITTTINGGTINDLYGAGNLAKVNGNVTISLNNATISNNIFGGGNEAEVTGNIDLSTKNTSAMQIYAGGNGTTAIVHGNTTLNIGANTVVGNTSSTGIHGSVFGGGNEAATGLEVVDNSLSKVNILGGTIYGNVYGGANTSVVYGNTDIRIGASAVNNQELLNTLGTSDIYIRGTIFGGGETNKNQSETFDYDAISVTQGININVNATDYNNFTISGSIFGSGNASNTPADKPSTIEINNYGTIENPKFNLSIQRVHDLIINNSVIELSGVRDSTDDYHPTDLFSLNRIKSMTMKNNTILYLRQGTNYLEELKSLDALGNKAYVTIDEFGNTMKNTDNRLYVLEGKHINLAHDGSATDYANAYGMTFFGMYTINSNNRINMKMFNPEITTGTTANWADVPVTGSYVLGKHENNHNTTIDGFYSNFMDEDNLKYIVKYIEPTPTSSSYYYWMIGENVIEYTVNLVASKYSTLGTTEISLRGLDKPNTSFQVLGFDYSGMDSDISLVDKSTIKGLANSTEIANNTFGLSMQSSNAGWLNWGSTSFYSNETTPYSGTSFYIGDNTDDAPSLLFYLYHYKNLAQTRDMGTVSVQLMAITKLDDINSELQRIVIQINLSTVVYQTNEYEGAMTPGKKYELFTSTTTKITEHSAFSAYYSLFGSDTNLYQNGYKHVLTSNYVFPVNTKLTLIDLSFSNPKYYYYVINESDYNDYVSELNNYNEVTYPLTKFSLMGSLGNNYYDDATMNSLYYHDSNSLEEFIIQVDFSDASITANSLNKYLYPELQDANGNLIISALAIERDALNFHIYKNSESTINLTTEIGNNTFYNGNNHQIGIETSLVNSEQLSDIIFDTTYYEDNMGLSIYLTTTKTNESGETIIERVSGNTLLGSYFSINGTNYYPDASGETKLKYADRVGNIKSNIIFNLSGANIPTGDYQLNIVVFGSSDGIHYSLDTSKKSEIKTIPVRIVNSNYGLKVELTEESLVLVNGQDNRSINGILTYTSHLTDPNIRVRLYRRTYDDVYTYDYRLIDILDYVNNNLALTTNNLSYLLIRNPSNSNNFILEIKNDILQTGTYRLDFELYDYNELIGKTSTNFVIKNEHYE